MRIRSSLVLGVLLGWGPHLAADVLYTITDLGILGGKSSFACGTNNAGQIVGEADTSTGRSHGFLYSDGQMADLNDLIDLTQIDPALRNLSLIPSFINDRGQIVTNQ